MSATPSNEINLDDQEVERIITDDEGNRTYLVEVTGVNPIRIDHNKRYALDGTTLSAGQTHTVSNLRGQELYAAAHAGSSSLRVRYAGADVRSQPEREVSVVGDVTVGSDITVSDYNGPSIPTNESVTSPIFATDRATGAPNAAQLDLGRSRRRTDIHVDTSGPATLAVEVNVGGGDWLEYDTVSYSSATTEVEAFDIAFKLVRAYLDQNRNGITMSAKGE